MSSVRNVLLLMLSVAMAAPISPIDDEKANINGMVRAEKAEIPSLTTPALTTTPSHDAQSQHHSEPMQKASPPKPTIIVNSGDIASAAEAEALHPAPKPHEGFTGTTLLGALEGQAERSPLGDLASGDDYSRLANEYIDKVEGSKNLQARELPGIGAGQLLSSAPAFIEGLIPPKGVGLDRRDEKQGRRPEEAFPVDLTANNIRGDIASGLTGGRGRGSLSLKPTQAIDAVRLGSDIEDWVRDGIKHEEQEAREDLPIGQSQRQNLHLHPREGISAPDLPTALLHIAADPQGQLGQITKGFKIGSS
ncbi:hypothetical protein VTN77DRAFT_7319 [Rasamsonia byssochlamydoides]|uniref:uncharacterized protein n=1 Tax=Rasamsonia byssochlamydoides TaxID=89139 RepID=UPI00374280AA